MRPRGATGGPGTDPARADVLPFERHVPTARSHIERTEEPGDLVLDVAAPDPLAGAPVAEPAGRGARPPPVALAVGELVSSRRRVRPVAHRQRGLVVHRPVRRVAQGPRRRRLRHLRQGRPRHRHRAHLAADRRRARHGGLAPAVDRRRRLRGLRRARLRGRRARRPGRRTIRRSWPPRRPTGAGIAHLFAAAAGRGASCTGLPPPRRGAVESPPDADRDSSRRSRRGPRAAGAFAVGSRRASAGCRRPDQGGAGPGTRHPAPRHQRRHVGPSGTVLAGETLGIDGLSPYFMPNDDFYRIDTALRRAPGRPRRLDAEDQRAWSTTPSSSPTTSCWPWTRSRRPSRCRASPTRSAATSSATPCWQGVPARRRCSSGPACRPAPTQIVGTLGRRLHRRLPDRASAIDGRTALLAVGMNGEPLPVAHGFPARLVVAGPLRLRVGHQVAHRDRADHLGRLRRLLDPAGLGQGGPDQDPVPHRRAPQRATRRRRPAADRRRGLGADRGIAKVEVQVDDGDWHEASLGDGRLRRHLGAVGARRGTPRPATTSSASGPPTARARPRPRSRAAGARRRHRLAQPHHHHLGRLSQRLLRRRPPATGSPPGSARLPVRRGPSPGSRTTS